MFLDHRLFTHAAATRLDLRIAVASAAMAGLVAGPVVAIASLLCMTALAAAVARRRLAMLVLYFAALVASADALLIAPIVVAMLVRHWAIAAGNGSHGKSWGGWPIIVMAGACLLLALYRLTGALAAVPLADLSAGAPTVWAVATLVPTDLPLLGLALGGVAGAAAMAAAHFSTQRLDDRTMLAAAAFTALVIAALLPGTTAVTFALPAAVAAASAGCTRMRRGWCVTALIAGGGALAAIGYPAAGALAVACAVLSLGTSLRRSAANDNQSGAIWPILARNG